MRGADLRDRALDLSWRPLAALISIPLFALYFGGVVGGSIVQSMVLPGANMGWLQQVGGALAVVIGIALLPNRRILLAFTLPKRPWLSRAILVGLSITAAGEVAGLLTGDTPEWHGPEYFAYQATMPGLGEELGFRGLVLGVLIAALLRREAGSGKAVVILFAAATPFALLHILDQSGVALVTLFAFTLYAGFVLGWVRLTSGSLIACIVAHHIANVASGLLDNLLLLLR